MIDKKVENEYITMDNYKYDEKGKHTMPFRNELVGT